MKSERSDKSASSLQNRNSFNQSFFPKNHENSMFKGEGGSGGDFIQPVVQMKKNKYLPGDFLAKMETSFGEDFSDVEIHEYSSEAKDLNARAFTQGNQIHFKGGEFNVTSQKGQELVAHELSHVVQQRKGLVTKTHQENNYNVNSDVTLEEKADVDGKRAMSGEKINNGSAVAAQSTNGVALQKKSQPIQLWRDVPGQARIESTAPNTVQAWEVFMRAVRQASGQIPESELRRMYYNTISQRLRGSFQPINIDAHTTDGYNRHWTGTIRFVFGDTETALEGGGVGKSTLSSASGSSQSMEASSSYTAGSSGGLEVNSTPGDGGGTGGSATAGGSGSTATGISETQGDTQSAGSSSEVNQRLNRFSSQIGIEVNISVSYDMGSSWTDWVNPFAYSTWAGASAALESGSATGACGTVIYYKGGGIAR